ncbi:MAG: hypothetical protein BM485_02010 [Desulfobulbaceae bacterium DB1]|nr:MAG: hypothetical protein BM485_02010 [Desulfobulbaceae bacterium DB1]
MKTYLCTCGVSVLVKRRMDFDRLRHVPLSERAKFETEINALKDRALDALELLRLPGDLNETSAEIKSLVRMNVSRDDKVELIATDTLDGRLCAEIVRDFLVERNICPAESVRIENIVGLQATDGLKFRKEGLKNLFDYLLRFEHEDALFNPTGGFKSVVPYVTLAGMLFNKPVCYIHEDSDDLITLAGLPVVLDDDIIFQVEGKLRFIERESSIPVADWKQGIAFYDRRFDILVEESDDQVTLSGLGFLFWEKFKADYPEDLLRTDMPPKGKKINLGAIGHHGQSRLKNIADKLVLSPFVAEVLNSCDFQPKSRKWVKSLSRVECRGHIQTERVDVCMVTDVNSDKGYSLLVATTARNEEENNRIAEILAGKFFGANI